MVPQTTVFDLVNVGSHWPKYLGVPKLQVPTGTRVVSVTHDERYRSFVFVLSHPSWPEVPEGELIPELEPWLESQVYERRD